MKRYFWLHGCIFGCLLGVYAAKFTDFTLSLVALVGLLSVLVAIKLPRMWAVSFVLLGVVIGMARAVPIQNDHRLLESLKGRKISLKATVTTDPVYHESGQYELNANNLRYINETIDATIRIRSFTNDVSRGDTIQISGKLRDGFASWQASMYFAELEVLNRDSSALSHFRSNFIASLYTAIPDPEASLGLGFLIGIRTLLPDELSSQLAITGLTHIVAVSGYNLTILVNSSKRILSRFSRFQALVGSLSLLMIFVSITGWSPSITRAVIVALMSIGAWYYGRKAKAWVLLLYSSSLSALISPEYPWSSLGWYLSLFAFYGVLVIAPTLRARLYKDREPGIMPQIVLETTAAQVMTMPLIMLVFGEVSVISLIANALVLPLIPLAMMATFVAGIAGMVGFGLAGIVANCSYIILQSITSVILILSNVDWALVPFQVSLIQMLILYAVTLFVVLLLRRRRLLLI